MRAMHLNHVHPHPSSNSLQICALLQLFLNFVTSTLKI